MEGKRIIVFKQKTGYGICLGLVGSGMCIKDGFCLLLMCFISFLLLLLMMLVLACVWGGGVLVAFVVHVVVAVAAQPSCHFAAVTVAAQILVPSLLPQPFGLLMLNFFALLL